MTSPHYHKKAFFNQSLDIMDRASFSAWRNFDGFAMQIRTYKKLKRSHMKDDSKKVYTLELLKLVTSAICH